MDFEKAFDCANRAEIISKLIEKGCGKLFTSCTSYIPTVNNKIGPEIRTCYGVAQGRHSSPNLYSFFVSDMPKCTDGLPNIDFQ